MNGPYSEWLSWLPPEGVKIALVLFLSFLIGLEREEHKATQDQYVFGGVRSFPLIGLLGFVLAALSSPGLMVASLGLAVVAAFLLLSYRHKLSSHPGAGMASELSGLATYLVGILVWREQFWLATTISVASLLLLELKGRLEALARRLPPREIFTFAQFLLITAVVLPILPDRAFGPFQLNPARAWLAVIAVSAISYASYVCLRLSKSRGGLVLTAVLGGAYSSTVTTVALAKRAAQERRPQTISGAILVASGIMYLRLLILIGLFNGALSVRLAPAFLTLSALAVGAGLLWSHRGEAQARAPGESSLPRNPLELGAALLFGALFVALTMVTRVMLTHAGTQGVYFLAALMGVADVDPFILSLSQSAGATTPDAVAAAGIVIAAAGNNAVKGIYAYLWADRETGRKSLWLLAGLALLGLSPLVWLIPG